MPKKIDEAEVKKECPSCGLGVALDSSICEFCGWDFQEEDEWILQIEKLERDLMLEKQKFEPGTFDEKVESTLHSPAPDRQQAARPAPKPTAEPPKPVAAPAPKGAPAPEPKKPIVAPAPAKPEPRAAPVTKAPEPTPPEPPSSKVRRMRIVKPSTAQAEPVDEAAARRKLVRKVKQR